MSKEKKKAKAEITNSLNKKIISRLVIIVAAKEISVSVDKISDASQNQKRILQELTKGVNSIEKVVQTNNVSAQESVVTSEELSQQSKRLHSLVNKFHLKDLKQENLDKE